MCAALWQADTHASLLRVQIPYGKLLCIIFIARTGFCDGARQNTYRSDLGCSKMFEGHNNGIAKVSHLDPNVATVKARLESLQNACDALRDSMALRRFLRTVGKTWKNWTGTAMEDRFP